MLRDQVSLTYAVSSFPARAVLCPDLALALAPRERPTPSRADVLWLARRDGETIGYAPPDEPGVEVVDWLEPVPDEPPASAVTRALLRWNDRMTERVHRDAEAARRWSGLLARTFDPLGRYWVDRGCTILARGRVVVTDRLHGHLLALLMGIPQVVLPNANGKIEAFLDTWTGTAPGVARAERPEDALQLALGARA
jgi:pyruvyl transferase EpsO